jgi:hypothetical protein
MAALEVETSMAEGEQARQAWSTWAREHAGPREAHAAAKGLFKRLWPMGLAAMTWSCAECGTGAGGAAMTRADGLLLTREKPLRGRQDFSLCGPCAGARTCDRTAGAPGICPLDAPVHRPERGDASVLPEWRTGFAVEPPVKERAGGFAQLCALEGAERVLREVAKAAPEDDAGVSAQRPVPPAARAGALLVVRVDG